MHKAGKGMATAKIGLQRTLTEDSKPAGGRRLGASLPAGWNAVQAGKQAGRQLKSMIIASGTQGGCTPPGKQGSCSSAMPAGEGNPGRWSTSTKRWPQGSVTWMLAIPLLSLLPLLLLPLLLEAFAWPAPCP